jgi:hypothetical protein
LLFAALGFTWLHFGFTWLLAFGLGLLALASLGPWLLSFGFLAFGVGLEDKSQGPSEARAKSPRPNAKSQVKPK